MKNEELKGILERVQCLYFKYGIKSVTMDDVAHELRISKKTLYEHFKDKADLVEKVFVHFHNKHEEKICDIQNQKLNAIEQLLEINWIVKELLKEYNPSVDYDLQKYYPALYRKISREEGDRLFYLIVENVRQGKKEDIYRKDVKEEIIAKVYVYQVENVMNSQAVPIEELLSEEFYNEIFIYHIRGVANEKGIKFLERKLMDESKNEVKI